MWQSNERNEYLHEVKTRIKYAVGESRQVIISLSTGQKVVPPLHSQIRAHSDSAVTNFTLCERSKELLLILDYCCLLIDAGVRQVVTLSTTKIFPNSSDITMQYYLHVMVSLAIQGWKLCLLVYIKDLWKSKVKYRMKNAPLICAMFNELSNLFGSITTYK